MVRASGVVMVLALTFVPPLYAQQNDTSVSVGAAFGSLSLDGIAGGVPPAVNWIGGGLTIGVGRRVQGVRLSVAGEVQWSGRGTGDRQFSVGTSVGEYRERRRDVLTSILAGIEMWEPHRVASLHVVAGLSYVRPMVRAATRTITSAGAGDWTDTDVNYRGSMAPTIGADLWLTWGPVSAGPTYRWSAYARNVSPYDVGKPTQAVMFGFSTTVRLR
jgi:hypothetical protein